MKHLHNNPIVYIITQLELGGAQKICLSLLQGLEQENSTVFLISSDQGPLAHALKNKSNVILLKYLQRNISLRGILHEWQSFKQIRKELKKLKAQYPNIIAHTHSTKAGIIGRWAAWASGIKTRIHTIHGYAFHEHQSWAQWIAIYTIELLTSLITTHFVCVSSHDVKIGMRLFPNFAKKHSIIRAAVDQKKFYRPAEHASQFPTQNEPFIFGTISCFKPQKNLFDLLQAFKYVHMHNTNTRLEIIGDGTLRPAIEAWITQNNLQENVRLHGWQENVSPFMSLWHAFTMSSLWEGLPCAIIEARLLKIPIISYTTGGIPDVISHGENGLLYKQKDWQSLAQGMLHLSRDTNIFTKLQTYEDNLDDFENKQMIQEHIKLYMQIK